VKFSVRTPAKLNLGLEVIRKRPDGYHDLATVFQAIDIYDQIEFEKANSFTYIGDPRITSADDIVRPILEQAAAEQGWTSTLSLKKDIPIAAGLGGGSSDAALALKIAMFGRSSDEIRQKARSIGADVSFFIDGGTALASGVGDTLVRLPNVPLTFVIVTPDLDIPNKTTTLFSGLIPADFSEGATVRSFAGELSDSDRRGGDLRGQYGWLAKRLHELPNAFQRQMLDQPVVREAWQELESITGRVALSGAGPTIYSWHESWEDAREVSVRLSKSDRYVHIARGIYGDRHRDEDRAIRKLLTLLKEQS
jgi:4-diphosphocytidyl-2-C-methyl-D-erythritol kinase